MKLKHASAYVRLTLHRNFNHPLSLLFTLLIPVVFYLLLFLANKLVLHTIKIKDFVPTPYSERATTTVKLLSDLLYLPPTSSNEVSYIEKLVNYTAATSKGTMFWSELNVPNYQHWLFENFHNITYNGPWNFTFNENSFSYSLTSRFLVGPLLGSSLGGKQYTASYVANSFFPPLQALLEKPLTIMRAPYSMPSSTTDQINTLISLAAKIFFLISSHIHVPFIVTSLVTEKSCGFYDMMRISGMSLKSILTINYTWYYFLSTVMSSVNVICIYLFGVGSLEQFHVFALGYVFVWPLWTVGLSFICALFFKTPLSASSVMWFCILFFVFLLTLLDLVWPLEMNYLQFLPNITLFFAVDDPPPSRAFTQTMLLSTGWGIVGALTTFAYNTVKYQLRISKSDKTLDNVQIDDFDPGAVLSVRNLYKYFKDQAAVDNLSFDLYTGEIVALLGMNGSGKSTTVNIITGMIMKSGGNIKISGNMSFTPQYDLLPDDATVAALMLFFKSLRSYEDDYDILELLDLTSHKKKTVKQLSGGTKRRAVLACALTGTGTGDIVISDEATTGLSYADASRVSQALLSAREKGVSILMITHNMNEVEQICDRFILMKDGKLLTEDTPRGALLAVKHYLVRSDYPLKALENIGIYANRDYDRKTYMYRVPEDKFDVLKLTESCLISSPTLERLFLTYNE